MVATFNAALPEVEAAEELARIDELVAVVKDEDDQDEELLEDVTKLDVVVLEVELLRKLDVDDDDELVGLDELVDVVPMLQVVIDIVDVDVELDFVVLLLVELVTAVSATRPAAADDVVDEEDDLEVVLLVVVPVAATVSAARPPAALDVVLLVATVAILSGTRPTARLPAEGVAIVDDEEDDGTTGDP